MTTNTVEAPTVTVDPGQVIRVNARFPGKPEAIRFSFLPPQSKSAIHDPGAHEEGTEIQSEGDLHYYNIDTRNMRGGLGWWYFVSEDPDPSKRRAKVGRFVVNDVPAALYAPGGVLIGADEVTSKSSLPMWSVIAASGAAGALLGALIARRGTAPIDADTDVAVIADETPVIETQPPRPRSADGKFLSAAATLAEQTEDDGEIDASETSDTTTKVVLATLGIAALGAFGWWLWRNHLAAKVTSTDRQLPAHVGEDDSGFALLGVDEL